MEQVPQIAVLCHEYPEHLGGVVANNLVPMVVKYLTDPNNQVRKTSQAALLVLLEQELVSRADVHDQVNKFVYLCEDGVWGVRKACAEVFMGVSCGCSLPTRRNKLSPVFVSLLTDQSRWVRVAAFQNLGPFISTFADPSVTGLHYNEDGVLVIGIPADQQLNTQKFHSSGRTVRVLKKLCPLIIVIIATVYFHRNVRTQRYRFSPVFVMLNSRSQQWARIPAALAPFLRFGQIPVMNIRLNAGQPGVYGRPKSPKISSADPVTTDGALAAAAASAAASAAANATTIAHNFKDYFKNSSPNESRAEFRRKRHQKPVNIDMTIFEQRFDSVSQFTKSAASQITSSSICTPNVSRCDGNTRRGSSSSSRRLVMVYSGSSDANARSGTNGYYTLNTLIMINADNVIIQERIPKQGDSTGGSENPETNVRDDGGGENTNVEPMEIDETVTSETEVKDQAALSAEEKRAEAGSSSVSGRSKSGSSGSFLEEAAVTSGMGQPSNSLTVSGTEGHLHVHLDNNPAFNSFNFWRLPLPHIELDIDIMGQTTNVCVKAKVQDNDNTYQSQVNLTMANNTPNPCISLATSAQEKLEKDKRKGSTVEADLEALAATLEGVTTSESSTDDMEVKQTSETPAVSETDGSSSSQQESATSAPSTYAQVCAAAVSSIQHQNDPQPSILASRLTQARVSMTGGVVSEIKKREMDVVSPSDSSTIDITSSIPSLPSHHQSSQQSSLLQQRLSDPFAVSSPNIINPSTSENYSSTSENNSNSLTDLTQTGQDIVPKTLLEHYISMTDPMRAETVDNEITRHCAYSLPAVALTLGRRNWPVLKDTYETLAGDMHWKVRRTLAFSIHELAVILGEELAQSDLVPVFNGFIKDLDEVRIGVLKHLAHFLRLLRPQNRRDYLHRMDEFLRTDNENNWRFRLELATQLSDMIDLFSPQDCQTFLAPIALALMGDKVVHIRRTCYTLVCQLVRQLGCEGDIQYVESLSEQLRSQFACANTWSQRQSYAFLCGQLVAEQSLALQDFSLLFLPHLLALADDRVPNVRIAVSKMLATYIASLDHYQNPENDVTKAVQCTLEKLRQDKDRDVSYFASCPVNTELLLLEQQHEPSL
ncbi:unnamed protein product, partial [Meganyctiphanes norvegica]